MNAAATTATADAPPDAPERLESDFEGVARVHTADWRVKLFLAGLSEARRAQIARRPRFYRLPWLRRADKPDADDLPF